MKSNRFFALVAALFATLWLAGSAHATETPAPPPKTEQTPAPKQGEQPPVKPAARREDVEPKTLAEAKGALQQARDDRDAAESALEAEQSAHAETKKQLASAQQNAGRIAAIERERDDARAAETKAKESRLALLAALQKALGLSEEQAGRIDEDATIVPVAIENLAGRKAVEIAASQGVPAVPKGAPKAEAEEMKRADFDQLKPEAQNDYIRKGGKVVD